MTLPKIWVFAEAIRRQAHLHHPRAAHQGPRAGRHRRGGLRRRRRRCRGRRPRRARRHQGADHRRPRRSPPGRARGRRAGRRHRRTAPSAVLFADQLRRSRRRRSPVGEARPHGDHQQRRRRGRGHEPGHDRARLRWHDQREDHVHRRRARTSSWCGRSPSPPSPPAAAPAAVEAIAVPDSGKSGGAVIVNRHVEERSGPVARRGRHRRLRWSWPRREREVRDDRRPRQGPQGRSRSVAGHRRRRLGALQLPGRPDRQGRQAHRLHRGRHLRCHPAHGRHEGLQEHHRHQQGRRGADLRRSATSASWATCTRCSRRSSRRSTPARSSPVGRPPGPQSSFEAPAPAGASARLRPGARGSAARSDRSGSSPLRTSARARASDRVSFEGVEQLGQRGREGRRWRGGRGRPARSSSMGSPPKSQITVRSLKSAWNDRPLSIPQMWPSASMRQWPLLRSVLLATKSNARHPPEPVVVGLVLEQGEVVLLEVGVDEGLERADAERAVLAHDREGNEIPPEGGAELVGRDLAAVEPVGEVPERSLALVRLVDRPARSCRRGRARRGTCRSSSRACARRSRARPGRAGRVASVHSGARMPPGAHRLAAQRARWPARGDELSAGADEPGDLGPGHADAGAGWAVAEALVLDGPPRRARRRRGCGRRPPRRPRRARRRARR